MNRRDFIAAAGGAIAAPLAWAQATGVKRTLGMLYLDPSPPPQVIASQWESVALREFGWHEGMNLVVERRHAEGRVERLPELAAELVRRPVDVIWASGVESAIAAVRATQTIPIVFRGVLNPVEQGLVESLPRPGRNVTGIAWHTGGHVAYKLLELLKEIAPQVRRVSSIVTPTVASTVAGSTYSKQLAEADDAYAKMGMEVRRHEVRRREDFDAAFAAILESRAQAVFFPPHPLTFPMMRQAVEFFNSNRLISSSTSKELVQMGGLFSYGPSYQATIKDGIRLVDRIFRGAKPADLPVELPSRYEVAVNLKTAAHLGLKIPGSVLVRAEHVIE
jgi:putative ABC transport system substrate-binding protein